MDFLSRCKFQTAANTLCQDSMTIPPGQLPLWDISPPTIVPPHWNNSPSTTPTISGVEMNFFCYLQNIVSAMISNLPNASCYSQNEKCDFLYVIVNIINSS